MSRDIGELLDEERATWRPFEALDGLSDAQLEQPVPAAHDWSGRDLVAHLVGWLGDAIDVARELATSASSEARDRSREAFAARGDEINADMQAAWRALPISEVRRRLHAAPATLRDTLALVPPAHWDTDAANLRFIHIYTVEHYEDHVADLEAILDAAS